MRVNLSGDVMSDNYGKMYAYFGYNAIYPALVRKALEDNPAGEELVLELNSGGGSVWAGNEIYSVLRNSRVQTRVEIQSLAGSAASYLMLGADRIDVSPVAMVMLHRPATWTYGNDEAHRASLEMLDSTSQGVLNAYVIRSAGKRSREEFAELMHKESWLHASQAVEVGLADGVLYQEEDNYVLTPQVAASVGESLRMLAGGGELPDIETLRARYEAEMAAAGDGGEPEPEETPPEETPEETPEEQPGAEPNSRNPKTTQSCETLRGEEEQGNADETSRMRGGERSGLYSDESTPWQAAARLEIEKNRF